MYAKLTIIGNVGRDPVVRTTQSGQPVASFSVAATRTYKAANGEKRTETTWFDISAWGARSEYVAKYIKKGSKVLVEGRLTPDAQTGGPRIFARNDGTWSAKYEITADNIQALIGYQTNGQQQAPSGNGQGSFYTPPSVNNTPASGPYNNNAPADVFDYNDPMGYGEDIPF
ncbi:MAG: single-stranded DNA-binding protein [Anaerolineaceae bacterium]|nr:single-stranded DNA-binding protein [Anaerolineaceae bacterium]